MGHSVRLDCSSPELEAGLAARGIRVAPDGAATFADLSELSLSNLASLRRRGPVIVRVRSGREVAAALDAGADDAVLRTASPDEIAARIAARMKLVAPPLVVGELIIDRLTREVRRAGQPISLFPREYALLLYLAQHAGITISRAELLLAVWGLTFDPGTNVVAVHVSRLRAKLDRGFGCPMLQTAKGTGYFLATA